MKPKNAGGRKDPSRKALADAFRVFDRIDDTKVGNGGSRPVGELLKFEVEIDKEDLDVIKHALLLGSVKDATDELVLHNRIACWRGKGGSAIVLKSVKVRESQEDHYKAILQHVVESQIQLDVLRYIETLDDDEIVNAKVIAGTLGYHIKRVQDIIDDFQRASLKEGTTGGEWRCTKCGHRFRAKESPVSIPASFVRCPICSGLAEPVEKVKK